jgi:hypothetical protein
MNPFTVSGIVAGVIAGFFVGRKWSEVWRGADDAARARATQRRYRGSTPAFIVGGLLLFGLALWFGHAAV